jgi:lysophospholipase L1-like esterase
MTIRLAWSCAIAVLVACKTAAPGPVRIQLFGDSTQWGYDPTTERPVAQPPVALLQAAMDARFGVGRVLVTERAAPGTTSSDLVAGKDDRNRPWPREVNADIVVVTIDVPAAED